MVDFSDPAEIQKNFLALKSVYHVTSGVYIWEFLTTLSYEANIIRGRRPYRWTIWIYSLARITSLISVVLTLVFINTMTPVNCQALVTFQVLFGYLSLYAASLLIVIRIIAIWNRNKFVVAIASSVWVTNVVVAGRGIARLRSEWDPIDLQCIVLNSDSSKLNIIVLVITDIVLLLTVLVGLFRWRRDGGGRFGIGGLLWKQGVMWLLLATVAEVPPAVFIILNLNGPLNLICQLPSVIMMSIAATRMYRSLTDFISSSSASTAINSNSKASKLRWIQTPFNKIHVTVEPSHQQSQASRTTHPCISTEEQPCDSDKVNGHEPRQQPVPV